MADGWGGVPVTNIQFIGAATSADAGTNVTTRDISKPTGTEDGDFMLAFIFHGADVTLTPPSGWNLLEDDLASTVIENWVYYKIASGEGSTYTWTVNTTGILGGAIVTYRGPHAVNGHRQAAQTTTDPVTGPNILPGVPSKVLYYHCGRDNVGTAMTYTTAASGVTERFDHGAVSGSVSISHVLYEKDEPLTDPGDLAGIAIDASATPTNSHARTLSLAGNSPLRSPGRAVHVVRQPIVRASYW